MCRRFGVVSGVLVSVLLLVLQGCSSGGGDGSGGGAQVQDSAEDPNEKPNLLGAISTSNTTVLLSFNKKMDVSAIEPGNYVITQETVNPEVGTVLVTDAAFLVDDTHSVVLTTSAQNELTYRVKVVNVKDVNGNSLNGKSIGADGSVIDPSSSLFAGTAPGLISVTYNRPEQWQDNNGNGVVDAGDSIANAEGIRIALVDADFDGVVDNLEDTNGNGVVDERENVSGLRDTDGDGLPDNVELLGTPIYVELSNGQFTTRLATSNPALSDTDGDGLSDLEEWSIGTDPRAGDSDTDGLPDYTEYNIIYSSPIAQDTDYDSITDGAEYSFYHTSPLLADTDGDKLDDGEELFELNRDPLVADLPKIAIEVGDVRLQLDERYTYTDESGNTVSQESSTSTSLANSNNTSHSTSDSTTYEWAVSVRTGVGNGSFFGGDKGLSGGVEVTGGGGGTYVTQTDDTSAHESQQAYENSLSKGSEYSTTSSVTREVIGARIDVDLSVTNVGNVPFSVSNLEVTVLEPSPIDSRKLVPVATLVANSELITGTPLVINLGPFNSQRGPFVFANREVFPNLVEALMRNPHGLVFRVANYDITDELGRNFAFSEQLARDRTASISLDQGDAAAAQTYQVATSGTLDVDGYAGGGYVGGFHAATGKPLGLSLDYLLQARLGLKRHDPAKDIIVPGPNGSLESQAAMAGDDEVETVDSVSVVAAGPNGWLETTPQGDDYVTNPNEPDGIVAGLNKMADSIAEGDDIQLVPVGTTGLSVGTVVIGAGENGKLDTQIPPGSDDKPEFVTGYETQRTCTATSTNNAGDFCRIDSDCQSLPIAEGACDGPQRLVRVNSLRNGDYNRGWVVLTDGEIPAAANFGDIVVKPGKNLTLAFLQDLDEDFVFARTEFLYGSIDSAADRLDNSKFGVAFDKAAPVICPSGDNNACDGIADSKDTDRDGIGDYAELNVGWKVSADGGPLRQVYSNPRVNDSDGDGLQDLEEQDLSNYCVANDPRIDGLCAYLGGSSLPPATDPSSSDTDLDGVKDKDEVVGFDVGAAIVDGGNGLAETARNGDDVQRVLVNNPVTADGIVILPGENGVIDTGVVGAGDDWVGSIPGQEVIACGNNLIVDTVAIGDDIQYIDYGAVCGDPTWIVVYAGPNGVLDTLANWRIGGGDDHLRRAHTVTTDPLRRDTDNDTNSDGRELVLGSDPTVADGADFRDGDRDGLTDNEESQLGWAVSVNGGASYTVKSSPSLIDTDSDGLPDFIERDLRTDPNKADTDGDGLSDYDEVQDFARFVRMMADYPAVSINGSGSMGVGTDPLKSDTDNDGLSDYKEHVDGTAVTLPGDTAPRIIKTSPVNSDTDGDQLSDYAELCGALLPLPVGCGAYVTDPTNNDTDGDGRDDKVEIDVGSDPLVVDRRVKIRYSTLQLKGGGQHWGWYFSARTAGEWSPGQLLSSVATDAAAMGFTVINAATCTHITTPNLSTIYFNGVAERNVTLRPGEVVVLSGKVSNYSSCDNPNPIVASDCTFNASISYDDAAIDTSTVLTTTAISGTCSQDITYDVINVW